jgi:CBS domain-containing protein
VDAPANEKGLIVGDLEAAERQPVCIDPSAPIRKALTEMDFYQYSQLPVVSGRTVRGIVSHKSISEAQLHHTPSTVQDCLDTSVPRVELSEPLLNVVDRFKQHDVVLVFGRDRQLSGLVTPADIAEEFRSVATPFLMIGQIEEKLRWIVRTRLDPADLDGLIGEPRDGVDEASLDPAALTMGELQRILERPRNWERLGIRYDQKLFCQRLNAVREIRNSVMHFRDLPDGSDAALKAFARLVQTTYYHLRRSTSA